jgi:hypothetical protein
VIGSSFERDLFRNPGWFLAGVLGAVNEDWCFESAAHGSQLPPSLSLSRFRGVWLWRLAVFTWACITPATYLVVWSLALPGWPFVCQRSRNFDEGETLWSGRWTRRMSLIECACTNAPGYSRAGC